MLERLRAWAVNVPGCQQRYRHEQSSAQLMKNWYRLHNKLVVTEQRRQWRTLRKAIT